MSQESVVVYQDFRGGEFGSLGAWKSPANSFTALNMLVNRLGELCVRPGLKNITPSGTANGLVHAFGATPVPLNDLFYVQGTAVRTFSTAGNNLKTSGTALAGTPTAPCDWVQDTSTILIASPTDKIYRLTPQTGATVPTVAGLTGSPGVSAITVYGAQVIGGNINGSAGYRMRFSDILNPNSWPAANFIDIGDGWQITNLAAQRQHLLINKQFGFFILTGVPGVNHVIRRVAGVDGVLHPLDARIDKQDRLWYQSIFAKFPAVFDGTQALKYEHLDYASTSPNDDTAIPAGHGVAPLDFMGGGSVFVTDNGEKCALFVNGVWTFHTFDVAVSGYIAGAGNLVHISDGGGASASPKFYTWNPCADTPGIEGGSGMKAGDDSTTPVAGSVTFPEWWADDGDEFYVRSVVVDFRSWNTGGASNNHFDLSVTALRRYQAGAAQASTTVSFDQAVGSSSASGTLQRNLFGFGEQGIGNGFQLAFSACKGVAIQRVTVNLQRQGLRK